MSLFLELNTKQKLSPSIIQLLSLIQMSDQELESYVGSVILENPVFDLDADFYQSSWQAKENNRSEQTDNDPSQIAVMSYSCFSSLIDDVQSQLLSRNHPKVDIENARLLSLLLDDKAYLSEDDFSFICKQIGLSAANKALSLIQSLEPAGIGARSVEECLCLQLRALSAETSLAQRIVSDHLDLLAKGHYSRIATLLNSDISNVRAACDLIRSLNPYPCSYCHSSPHTGHIVPDLILDQNGELKLNSSCSYQLGINNYYSNLIETCSDLETIQYLKEKISQAQQLTKNIQLRRKTILSCASAIISAQSQYFASSGKAALVPLTQESIAEKLDISKSTVSRIVNNKYLQCSFGTFPLHSFFSSALTSDSSHEVSSHEIKLTIKSLINSEDKRSPISDQDIVDILSEQGITISRRAVSKYRTQLNIPSTFIRKVL